MGVSRLIDLTDKFLSFFKHFWGLLASSFAKDSRRAGNVYGANIGPATI